MTAQERAVWAQMERQAADIGPAMRAAVLRLFALARATLSDAELARLIQGGQIETVVARLVAVMEATATVQPMREAIREAYASTAQAAIRTLPFPTPRRIDIAFDFLNPRVVEAIRTLESRALGTLTTEAAETVRQVVRAGIEAGVGPRALIPQLRASIGLAPNQEAAVANFRAALESGDFAKARGYALRDKRFDAMLRRVDTLTPDQIDRMTSRYRQGMQAFNAETHARTAALDAARAGQRESIEAAIQNGGLDRNRMRKRWVATMDARVRPEHAAAHGIEVQIDALFPVDGGVHVPGENTYGCRCAAAYRYARNP